MRKYWTGCILLSTALSSSAVTLGRHSGAAMIGRALDVRVQVLLAPGEDLANLCIETDVFYGDTQVSGNLVRTSPQRTTPDAEATVRVQSSLPVNEPFVTLYVRAGCGTQFTRRYVLLADLINEPVSAGANSSSNAQAPVSGTALPSTSPRAPVPANASASSSQSGAPSGAATATAQAPVPMPARQPAPKARHGVS